MDLAGQRYAHLKFDLKLKRPTYRTGVPKSRIQKRTSNSCSATPKTQGIPRFQKLIRIFVTMATPGSRLVRDFETSSLKFVGRGGFSGAVGCVFNSLPYWEDEKNCLKNFKLKNSHIRKCEFLIFLQNLKWNRLNSLLQKTASKMTDWMTRNSQINDSPNLLGHPVYLN